jgi:hypothetical protein
MGLFKKNPDPITDRSRELTAKISSLEAKIKRLNQEIENGEGTRNRPTAQVRPPPGTASQPPKPHDHDPVFERVDQGQLNATDETPPPAQHFNDLGVRKYDLMSLVDRLRKQFQSPPAANPKLVSYLAAGSIQGLRPLRYEKRVMRNRCIALGILLLLVFLGIFYVLEHRH